MPFDRDLLQEQDAVLLGFENSARLLEALSYYTVPLMFFKKGADRERLLPEDFDDNSGSGVLVEVGGQHFILTAGHCVELYQQQLCAIGVEKGPHCYAPERWPSSHRVTAGGRDYGFILVPETEVGRFTAGRCLFAGPKKFLVIRAGELKKNDDWMILAGYPLEIQAKSRRGMGSRLFVYPTTLAGSGSAPQSALPTPTEPVEYIDIWVPRYGGVDPARNYADVDIPLLGGASGGGCWRAGVRGRERTWSPRDLRLAAVHVASQRDRNREHRFGREILVGHHLRLIAEEDRVLRSKIFALWPFLADDCWTP